MSAHLVPMPSPPPVNVLLVDDRADKLLALESILADGDHTVVTARSGEEALRALLRTDFAVILLDVNMPQLDGFQTAALIRGRPSSEKVPIIFMTAVSDMEAGTSRGYSLGAVDYIHLPVQPEVLKAKVSVFVDLYRKREQVREQAESLRLRQEREHATRLAEAADRLDFETRRNRFFTLAPDMLGIADFDGRLRQLNASWERTLGITAGELCGRPTVEFLHPEDQQAMRDHLRDLSAGAPTARFENRHRHGDGSYRWLAWTAAPFREEGLVYFFVRDVTYRKVAEEERLQLVREQEARRAAERENTIKDQFLATLSHELRSPLTPILGWTTMLRSGQLGGLETARALDVIERNAKLQAQLIDDLLDVSRIVSGKLRMDLRPIDLRDVVEAALDAVQAAAEKRKVKVEVHLGPTAVRVVGDPERLQQVVWNLAANAVKFSSEGGSVQVRLDLEADAACLCVRDNGVGISPEFLPHVFDRFQQATSGSTRTHGGLGLGLTIVRHIARAHGGIAEAASDGVGRGACFTVTLPRARDTQVEETTLTTPTRGEVEGRGEVLGGQLVLVVDDEPDVREVLRLVLERQGARVVTAGSVAEATVAYEAECPNLVVSDIGMPGADGYALMDRLRSRTAEGRPVSAVALTAYATPEDAARVRASGFRAHLAKPVDPRLVVETLVGLLSRNAGEAEGHGPPENSARIESEKT
jgi:PAS domain S-box-containing protein